MNAGSATPAFGGGWDDDAGEGGDFGQSGEYGDGARPSSSIMMLNLAAAAAVLGLIIGVVLLVTVSDPSVMTVAVAVVGWLLSGIVAVLGVAAYQSKELIRSANVWHVPHASAAIMRLLPLIVGTLGVIANAYFIARWVAYQ